MNLRHTAFLGTFLRKLEYPNSQPKQKKNLAINNVSKHPHTRSTFFYIWTILNFEFPTMGNSEDLMDDLVVKPPDSAVATPLSAIAEAFEELAKCLKERKTEREELRLDTFCRTCSLVPVLFHSLGLAFKFAELEYVAKVPFLILYYWIFNVPTHHFISIWKFCCVVTSFRLWSLALVLLPLSFVAKLKFKFLLDLDSLMSQNTHSCRFTHCLCDTPLDKSQASSNTHIDPTVHPTNIAWMLEFVTLGNWNSFLLKRWLVKCCCWMFCHSVMFCDWNFILIL